MKNVRYHTTAERPALELWWFDDDGTLIDFSTGYTFSLKVGSAGSTALLTKTSDITGAAGAGVEPTGTPNVVVTWTAGELALTTGTYLAQLTATSSSLDRVAAFQMQILPVIT
jgi:hypothetical protein